MKIEINVELIDTKKHLMLTTANDIYEFDIFINNKHYDSSIVQASSYEKAVQWIANNMLNHVSTLNHIRSIKK